ncbi:OLC1v1012773C1 [Oldenlandia corymbosa var. corymbosa]|uniref:OLC1v1012773C1 n=1 Tax=Oldenlandia corymbosa var. corymbosa TaxID=529605 RepID=A0AAV1DYQ6_OLDCO|nr:OLC1v1012773C1 [Oldenlandia corymbosa var. corymbosa]
MDDHNDDTEKGSGKVMWTLAWETALVDILLAIKRECNKATTNFKPSRWTQIANELKSAVGVDIGFEKIKSKVKRLKRDWKICDKIKMQTGVGWNDEMQAFVYLDWAALNSVNTTTDDSPGIQRSRGKRPVEGGPSGVDSCGTKSKGDEPIFQSALWLYHDVQKEKQDRMSTKVKPARAAIEALYTMDLSQYGFRKAVTELNKQKHKALIFLALRTEEKYEWIKRLP